MHCDRLFPENASTSASGKVWMSRSTERATSHGARPNHAITETATSCARPCTCNASFACTDSESPQTLTRAGTRGCADAVAVGDGVVTVADCGATTASDLEQ